MIYSQAAAAHIYIGVAIILAILVTSIFGVALSIILNLRSDQHEQKSVFRLWARRQRSGSRKRVADRKKRMSCGSG